MISLSDLNDLDRAPFVAALDGVFEHSPWVTFRAWGQRPFANVALLHKALIAVVEAASVDEKLALIRAHPDLVGTAARAGTLSPESTSEQASLERFTPEEIARIEDYNRRYRKQFEFPFVICVRENKRQAILGGFERRLRHDAGTEQQNALAEIGKIAWFRIKDRVITAPES